MRLLIGSMTWLAASALLIGCSIGSPGHLSDTEWTLETLRGVQALQDVSVTMTLADDGQLFGSGGCNRYVGTWAAGDDGVLTLEANAQTLMACEEAIADQEAGFFSALADTTTYRLDKDELTLQDTAGNEVATMAKLTPAKLTDTPWEVTAYNNGRQAVVSVLTGTSITARFGDDDRVTGNAGCNNYFAGYSTDGDTITIEQVATTRKACDQPIMEQEDAYVRAIEQAVTYELGAKTLHLRAADGSLLVSYKVAE